MTSSSSAWKQHVTWQDRGGDGKDGVKQHKDWKKKIWGTSKRWQLIWFKKEKKKLLESVRWTVWDWACWHRAGHEVTQVQVGATRHHFSRQQSRMGCEESCSSSIWTRTRMSPSESRRQARFVIYGGDVINSPVTNRHAIIFISAPRRLLRLTPFHIFPFCCAPAEELQRAST